MRSRHRSRRNAQRGMLLLMVLAILVLLSLIGIAFGYLVSSERRSAQNALDRFRALSVAKDGEAYAIASLRILATYTHYEFEGTWSFNRRVAPDGRLIGLNGESEDHEDYLRRGFRTPVLGINSPEQIVSLSRSHSSNAGEVPDANWVDTNGNGTIEPDEDDLARDLLAPGTAPLNRVSYFAGDGVDMRTLRTNIQSGTYRELGDRARLKIIDTNAQLNINDYAGEQLRFMLMVLGHELAALGSNIGNPFPPNVAGDIVIYKQLNGGKIQSKGDLRQFFDNEQLYQFAMDFIAVESWPLRTSDSGVAGGAPNFVNSRNPGLRRDIADPSATALPNNEPFRKKLGFQPGSQQGQDGNPEELPTGNRSPAYAPVNINTVSKPVLTTLLAGIEAEARFLYFPRTESLVDTDKWIHNIKQMKIGTTDYGRQPLLNAVGQSSAERELAFKDTGGIDNLAIYQVIPVGPLGHAIKPLWKTTEEDSETIATQAKWDGHHASNLASLIIRDRERFGPFKSWMDFDYRICHQILLGFNKGISENVADLVNTQRTSRMEQLATTLANYPCGSGTGDRSLLPDPRILRHPAGSANQSADHSYSAQEFDAWYWRASVDMIRAALNPNGYLNKFNPDAPYYTTVDSTDLRYATAPICFNTCGVYEIVTQGEIAREQASAGGTHTETIVARRTFRSLAEIYRILEHTTQQDFLKPILRPNDPTATSAPTQKFESVVTHDLNGTQTWPNSIDHSKMSYADKFPADRRQSVTVMDGSSTKIAELTGGYFKTSAADSLFGWVSLYPLDRTPHEMTENDALLNFHATFVSLEALRRMGRGNKSPKGHVPFSGGTVPQSSDMWSSATPDANRQDHPSTGTGFQGAAGQDSANYATLRPDGALLRGWHFNPMFRQGGSFSKQSTYGQRKEMRMSRLAMLRYRAGAYGDNPYSPVGGANPKQDDEIHKGSDIESIVTRLVGAADASPKPGEGGKQGTDQQNINVQDIRQFNSNFPYYQGWIDFWIKWELPPQGTTGKVACAGEIDPASANFSGLIGACSFGRFVEQSHGAMDENTDFEGCEFFVFKEPGGILRISQIYFTRAWKSAQWAAYEEGGKGSGYSYPTNWARIGDRSRISGKDPSGNPNGNNQQMNYDEYAGTNDIASGTGDLGFSYARTESYVNLTELTSAAGVELVTHNWYRLSIKYLSNHRSGGEVLPAPPHEVMIDGRPLEVQFTVPDPADQNEATNVINTGELTDPTTGQPLSFTWIPGSAEVDYDLNRRATLLLEVDPEDRLTIGCICRRQQPQILDQIAAAASTEDLPLFRFDTNLVAPANATLDDVRIAEGIKSPLTGQCTWDEQAASRASRFERKSQISDDQYYENGFVASYRAGGLEILPFPVRIGSFTWTEYRPTWDSFKRVRTDTSAKNYAESPQITFALDVLNDIRSPEFVTALPPLGTFSAIDRSSPNFWCEGGVVPERRLGNPVTLNNLINATGSSRVSMLRYRAYFICPNTSLYPVLNMTPVLDDVRMTILTPPKRLMTEEIYQ
ncbi:MAG: hypothetical protein HUU29_05375 [Planctomycetaceae bacterium]|nr:hypothetical protein [Planctomycetaceae bacterium]